jgi:hypothetical protein
LYLEIGIRTGGSLRLASGKAIGVDPSPADNLSLPRTTVIAKSSDDFFNDDADRLLVPRPSLAFIDGMHLFEYALRDFINVERYAFPGALVVIDDIFPNHPVQARRSRETAHWTGDVWRLFICLKEERPDLFLLPLDTAPSGLLLVAGLDPDNHSLEQRHGLITSGSPKTDADLPTEILSRKGAVSPHHPLIARVFNLMRSFREREISPPVIVERLRATMASETA